MITYIPNDWAVVTREFPDEITLAVNLYDCPHRCKGCHSPELRGEGIELTKETISALIESEEGITCFGFMGGDNDMETLFELNAFIHEKYGIKTGWYSGWSYEDPEFREYSWRMKEFDYVKIGPYIEALGPLTSPITNQAMFKRTPFGVMKNITKEFQK